MLTIKTNNNNYKINLREKIGRGTFGIVFKCFEENNPNKIHACKFYQGKTKKENIMKEIKFQKTNKNEYILGYIDHGHDFIITEYMECDLFNFCTAEKRDDKTLYDIYLKIALGVQYLHETLKISHLDIKMENIQIKTDNNINIVKLCDFGSIKNSQYYISINSRYGTPGFAAPEQGTVIITGETFDAKKCDIFSLGLLMLYSYYKEYFFTEDFEKDKLYYFLRKNKSNIF